ncbi:thioesterase domain-containing protein [Streptomyces sp. NPDC017260]|uniref:thioesterase domain-containing protein n=1 Tax=unclassified Streptomyces TaxID=2593676 RepID=UPI0037BC52C3
MDSTRPALRLFVMHHAGGSHLLYRTWPAALPDIWDVRLLDAPGHGLLLDQPRIPDAGRLADHLLRHVEPPTWTAPTPCSGTAWAPWWRTR